MNHSDQNHVDTMLAAARVAILDARKPLAVAHNALAQAKEAAEQDLKPWGRQCQCGKCRLLHGKALQAQALAESLTVTLHGLDATLRV